jgi:hypothetical protein
MTEFNVNDNINYSQFAWLGISRMSFRRDRAHSGWYGSRTRMSFK